MNAKPWLTLAARSFARHRLEAVLIGNAAAALQGSPVTTVDLDFMFRKTALNLTKLKRVADDLGAVLLKPYYPASGLFRLVRDRDGLQFDFMSKLDGIRSYRSLRSRAVTVRFGRETILVAALEDIIKSKLAANRPQTRRRTALRRESDRALVQQIRRSLALPPSKRTNFLRTRLPGGGSAI